tara:strand:- start:3836 stop:4213 length:378 start_codon:yes stop_codon:yes gene_type:complete
MTSVYSTAEVVVPQNHPMPTGYHILVVLPKVEDKTKGGVILPTDIKNREDIASIVAKVVAVGPDAYPEGEARFRNGAWCQIDDWVLISKYSGHRFEYDNVEMRLINDDSVLATVSNPTKVSRANS